MKTLSVVITLGMLATSLLFVSTDVSARPRTPAPPFPELGGAALFHEGFDWVYGTTNVEVTVPGYGTLRESWSGYALQRSGAVSPFVVPAVDAAGHTNVASHAQAAVRFWVTPYWSSQSAGGAGPGASARLVELIAAGSKRVAVAWSLQVTADGNALVLLDESGTEPVELLRVPIAWESTAHCLALNFGPGGTALFVDGQWIAQGKGTVPVPPTMAGLAFGSSWSGNASVEGDLEEIDVFGRWLTEQGMGFYFGAYHSQAALGPVSEAEWQARREAMAKRKSEQSGGSQMMLLVGGTSECITNKPLYITNMFATNITGQGTTVRFDVQGTNGPVDIFMTTNLLGNSLTNSQWTWLERGPTCSTYEYTNQPSAHAFYVLGSATEDPDRDGLSTALERLVLGTSPTNADSPRVIYETAVSNQNPSAWFKLNDSSFTNSVTSGQSLTNGGGLWDPDAFAIGNGAYSFSTNLHKLVFTNDAIGGGTGDATNQGSFTLLFKAMATKATAKRYVLSQGTDTSTTIGNAIAVYFTNNGALNVGVGPVEQIILEDSNIVRGAWYYLAVTCYETNTSNAVRWYLGQVGSQTLQTGGFALGNAKKFGTTNAITLGNKDGSTASAFRESPTINGCIDEVAFWRRELTEAEVNTQFDKLKALFQGPSKVFDLTRWNLLLPVDKLNQLNPNNLALEIDTGWLNSGFKYLNPTNWTQQYFYLSNGNTMVFEAPWNGARSANGSGARSELRETLADGSKHNWLPLGTNTLEATCAVHSAGTNNDRKVIIGQAHSETADDPPVVISYNFPSSKNVTATYKSSPSSSADNNILLATNVNVLDQIYYKAQLTDDGTNLSLHVEASVNGVPQTATNQQTRFLATSPSDAWHTNTFYFKAGCYYPTNGPGSPIAGTAKVTFSSLTATHQP